MRYEVHRFIRKIIMRIIWKNCITCTHYDRKFGQDCCFECERSVKAVNYDRE